MSKFYITGVSGTGKSALVKELEGRGVRSFDMDAVEDLCYWRNKNTRKIADYQAGIGRDWIEAHDWICDPVKLKELLSAQGDAPVVIAGLASNQDEYLGLFDRIFLLHCQESTFLHRLNTRADNDFAKEKSEQEHILGWYRDFENRMMKNHNAIPIDTEVPINVVVDQIISQISPID